MIDLDEVYQEIYEKGKKAIQNRQEYIDHTIDDPKDTRLGLTITIRPCGENNGAAVSRNIENFITELEATEGGQYYYPKEDFHITLLDLIVAKQDFKYTQEQAEACIDIVRESIKNIKPFQIDFRGVIASDGAVLVKGYYQDELEALRQKLRLEIDKSSLVHDERYPARSCHITIARFRKPIQNRKMFQEKLLEYQNLYFGNIKVRKLELVNHNWFDSKKEVLQEFFLA